MSAEWDWLEKAAELKRLREVFVVVTLIAVKGSTPRAPGAKLLVLPDGRFFGTIGGGQLEHLLIEDAKKALHDAKAGPSSYPLCFRTGQCCGGAVDAFFEIVGLGPELYVFGGGHVGQALKETLVGTPFAVELVDSRAEWVARPLDPLQFLETARWDRERTYALVMTHDHALDLALVAALVTKPARFIGLIGSATKWDRFQQRLKAMGVGPDAIQRVHCPIGVGDLGKAPREVAISAAAQLLAVHHETAIGGFERPGLVPTR